MAHIAKNLFQRPLVIAGSPTFDDMDGHVAAEMDNIQAHRSDPKSMEWGDEDPTEPGYYSSVTMDGVTYWASTFSGIMHDFPTSCPLIGWRGCHG